MATIYKAFEMYYIDPDTSAVLSHEGSYLLAITSCASMPSLPSSGGDMPRADAIALLDNAGIDRSEVTGFLSGQDEGGPGTIDIQTRYVVQGYFPIVTTFPFNNNSIRASIKLVASNGYYAISNTGYGWYVGHNYCYSSSYGPAVFRLYNPDGVYMGNLSLLTGNGNSFLFIITQNPESEIVPNVTQFEEVYVGVRHNGNLERWALRGHTYTVDALTTEWLNAIPSKITQPDPYGPGGTSGPDHGEGSFDFTSDPISFQPPPVLGALNSGFVTLYRPEMSDIQNLARYMWAGAFDINNFKKLFADPMDAILGLSIVPLTRSQLQCVQDEIYVGNLPTGVDCDRIGKQYVTISCGSLTIPETWGAYLDYSPYTKMQLFLPYIGMVEINPDDCMRGVLTVQYNIDVYSGACNAQVYCWTQDDMYNGHVLYEFSGNCASWYPITAGQYQNFLISGYNILTGVGMGLSQVASGIEGLTGGEGKTGLGRSIGQMIGGSAASLEAIYSNVKASIKPQIQRTGGAGGSANLMGHQKPFLILTIPRMIVPGEQNAFIGYPSYVTMDLDDLNGFTIVDSIHIHGIPCTENEEAEILSLLKEGVFL